MSIPLDRLYHYLESLCSEDTLIYRWFPHGSKNLNDLKPLHNNRSQTSFFDNLQTKHIIFHDQEPLCYNFYSFEEFFNVAKYYIDQILKQMHATLDPETHEEFTKMLAKYHLRTKLLHLFNMHDKIMLCHSEKNSKELELYEQNGFVGVYYWSHALIALDWFRFAQHDTTLKYQSLDFQFDFLVYNRAWTGTREYRLKFTDLVVENNLVSKCNMRFNPNDSENYYKTYKFKNKQFENINFNLEDFFAVNNADSSCSADYDSQDYQTSAIEIILETLYDDTRLHLTEKTLRPIACGKPFIMLSSPGSLDYLRSYGFKTFNSVINESYDEITDPLERMQAIVLEIKRISSLTKEQKAVLWSELYKISEFNKNYFFSSAFFNKIEDEFVANFKVAEEICMSHMSGQVYNLGLYMKKYPIKNS